MSISSEAFTRDPRAIQRRFLSLARLFEPVAAVGHRKIRVGRPNDGGYVMLDDFGGITAALSLGVADDPSWDLAIGERGIPTFQFDHTINKPPAEHPNLTFART